MWNTINAERAKGTEQMKIAERGGGAEQMEINMNPHGTIVYMKRTHEIKHGINAEQ